VWCRRVDLQEWETAWKAHFRPLQLGRRIWLCPSWEKVSPAVDEVVVMIDPGMAFGTGTHPSTQLCMEYIEQACDRLKTHSQLPATVIDIGCGSGILSITTLKLGITRALGVDIDDNPVTPEKIWRALRRTGYTTSR
jgi:ribosomal protein L11 methyltransferase